LTPIPIHKTGSRSIHIDQEGQTCCSYVPIHIKTIYCDCFVDDLLTIIWLLSGRSVS
ncbi:hypothetical protein ACJX0J_016060, partial [Zea mays]